MKLSAYLFSSSISTDLIVNNIYSIINGDFVLASEARLLISDLALQRGYGIFDFFRTVNNQPLFMEDHLDRFYQSATTMHMSAAVERQALRKMILQLIEKNSLPDAGIRITLTGGYSKDGYTLGQPNLLITQNAFSFNRDNFYSGISLVTYDHQRQLPNVKTIDYLHAIFLQPFIKESHADDVLYYHDKEITECPRANFFIVTKKDEVITPAKNILKGITRKKILGLPGFNFKEAAIEPAFVKEVKEAFITSTTRSVLPVLKLNGDLIGSGKPGEITTAIFQKLLAYQEQESVNTHRNQPIEKEFRD